MKVDFSSLMQDHYGRLDPPVLVLMKPHEEIIGVLGQYFGLKMELKFSEPSTATFQYPSHVNGAPTPCYEQLVKDKLIQIDPFGVFVVVSANEQGNGVSEIKEVTLHSRERVLGGKKIVFAEGTYNFWNPAAPATTILGMATQAAPNWKVGYVSPTLIGRYRTFDETDDKVLDFLSAAQENYGCVVVYDSYARTINAYDTEDDVDILPLYLSYDNLVKDKSIKMLEDQFPTKLLVKGADGVDIREVNPVGDNYIYNLDYYIANGDLPDHIKLKWIEWQNLIFTHKEHYTSLVALRNAATTNKLMQQVQLDEMRGELMSEENVLAANLKMLQTLKKGSSSYKAFQSAVKSSENRCEEIEKDIMEQEALIEATESQIKGYDDQITDINETLRFDIFFRDDLAILEDYMRQDTFEDSTFAFFDVDTADNGNYVTEDTSMLTLRSRTIQHDDGTTEEVQMTWTDVECEGDHRISMVTNGEIQIVGNQYILEAAIDSGTYDHYDGQVVFSVRLGAGTLNGSEFSSGNLSCSFKAEYDDDALLSNMNKHSKTTHSYDGSMSLTTYYYTGTVSLEIEAGAFYFTRNVTEYQKFTVQQELYEYATQVHAETASPTYEFEIESGNFIADPNFAAFKNRLQLGCACYLQMDETLQLNPLLVEVHLDYEDLSKFKLVFSNTFRRTSDVTKLSTAIRTISSSSTDFNSQKFSGIENNNATTYVQNLLRDGWAAAMARITSGDESLVTIDKAGIKIDSTDGVDRIYLTNGMIALYDKRKNEVRMAMGHFMNSATGGDFIGVLADVIGGTLLAGSQLIIEGTDASGEVLQFKVDSSGAWLMNGTFIMDYDKGGKSGKIMLHPQYGIAAGTKDLYALSGTAVAPSFINSETGTMIREDDSDMPKNTNFFLDIRDGSAYFKGTIYATDGSFTGDVTAKNFYFKDGNDVRTLLNNKAEFDLSSLKKIDLGGIVIDGTKRNITFNGEGNITFSNDGSITFGTNNDLYDTLSGDIEDVADDIDRLANGKYSGTFISKKMIYSPQIYAGTSSEPGDTYACMTGDSFALRRKNDSEKNSRAELKASDNDVTLYLGVGTTGTTDAGRFIASKWVDGTTNKAKLEFIDIHGRKTGLYFSDSGKVTTKGLYLTFS